MAKTRCIQYFTCSSRGHSLTRKHEELINEAQKRFGPISPCGSAKDFRRCFSRVNGRLIFWFNSHDGSTHIVQSAYRKHLGRINGAKAIEIGADVTGYHRAG